MKVEANKEMNGQQYINPDRSRKTEIIRAIQQAERNQICFGTDRVKVCNLKSCLWREDCV